MTRSYLQPYCFSAAETPLRIDLLQRMAALCVASD